MKMKQSEESFNFLKVRFSLALCWRDTQRTMKSEEENRSEKHKSDINLYDNALLPSLEYFRSEKTSGKNTKMKRGHTQRKHFKFDSIFKLLCN